MRSQKRSAATPKTGCIHDPTGEEAEGGYQFCAAGGDIHVQRAELRRAEQPVSHYASTFCSIGRSFCSIHGGIDAREAIVIQFHFGQPRWRMLRWIYLSIRGQSGLGIGWNISRG